MTQGNLSRAFGVDMSATNKTNDVVEWLEDRPKHMLKVDDRELKVDFKSYSNPVREKVGGEIATFGGIFKTSSVASLKKSFGGFGQYSVLGAEPGASTRYTEAIEKMTQKLTTLLPAGSDLDFGTAGNELRFVRKHDDFDDDSEFFPNLRDYREAGDFNNAPELEDGSLITSRSLCFVAFKVKLWEKTDMATWNSPRPSPSPSEATTSAEIDVPATPTPTKGKGKGKGKAPVPSSPTATPSVGRKYGARLELVAMWLIGTDEGLPGEVSPRKIPRF